MIVAGVEVPAREICQMVSLLFIRNTLSRSVTRLYTPLLITSVASASAPAQLDWYRYTLARKAELHTG